MKHSTLLLILLFLVVLMAHNPKRTTSQITTGENAAAHLGSSILGGLFPAAPGKVK